jgi:AcrR family transcriptional regulator
MKLQIQIEMNEKLFLKDPEHTVLGKKIILHSIQMIHKVGFESFTFKKLAEEIRSTEAGVYRYFENKHKLLIYIIAWYWTWLDYRVKMLTLNITTAQEKLKKVIEILATTIEDDLHIEHVNESILHQIVIVESSKTYLTNHVTEDNKDQLFKPYKDLTATIGSFILACNNEYPYPKSLATTIIEMAHHQNYFMHHLPALTDFGKEKSELQIVKFLEDLVFSAVIKQEG